MTALDNYAFAPSRPEHARLVALANAEADRVREACARAGLATGQTAVDCGCGPLGALPVLAEFVGPTGRVLGVDGSADALATARELLPPSRYPQVHLLHADVNDLTPASIGAPGAALAFCRLFLLHQRDPAATLRRMAALVRPGGVIVAHEPLDERGGHPASEPPVHALGRVWALVIAAARARGARTDFGRNGAAYLRAAGLEVLGQRGHLVFYPPAVGFEIPRVALQSLRPTLLGRALADDAQLDALDTELGQAAAGAAQWCTSPLMVEWVARVPAGGETA